MRRVLVALWMAPAAALEGVLGLAALIRAVGLITARAVPPSSALYDITQVAPSWLWGLGFVTVGVWQCATIGNRSRSRRLASTAAGLLWTTHAYVISYSQPSVLWGPYLAVIVACILVSLRPTGVR